MITLGTFEAGKSTFVKQMRLLYGSGFTDNDKASFKCFLAMNLVDSVTILSQKMMKLGIAYEVSGVSLIQHS